MIYAINRRTREHRIISGAVKCIAEWDGWDVVEADTEGWIPWPGGKECPLPCNAVFDIRLRGELPVPVPASSKFPHTLRWTHDGSGGDIVAYRPILAPQPAPAVTAPEWDGEGLPPVGSEVEFKKKGTSGFRGSELLAGGETATVIGVLKDLDGDGVVVVHHREHGWFALDPACFRPIRSDEDRAVEAMTRLVAGTGCGDNGNTRAGMRALYREGYRKTEVPNEDA